MYFNCKLNLEYQTEFFQRKIKKDNSIISFKFIFYITLKNIILFECVFHCWQRIGKWKQNKKTYLKSNG